MTIPSPKNPTECPSWQLLKSHYPDISLQTLNQLFEQDNERASRFSYQLENLFIDLSKNNINQQTLEHLLTLAEEMELKQYIAALFNGEDINNTEARPALHTALRSTKGDLRLGDTSIQSMVNNELDKMELLCEKFSSNALTGSTGKIINTVINIGIGGSDLGPRLVCDALQAYSNPEQHCYFISNVDASDLNQTLEQCNPETTIIIVASKSFTTLETMMNAESARNWFENNACTDLSKHFIAVTANKKAALDFGIIERNIFSFWSWVGGRYSLWSSIGLPIALSIGMEKFRQLLSGAESVDDHFKNSPFAENVPVLLGLLDVWYSNFFQTQSLAIVPYDQNLKLLPDYLAQLIMESNGKNVDRDGKDISYNTAPIVWGSVGTNAQHAFFQALHQGTHNVAIDFLVGINNHHNNDNHQQTLVANCFAQSEALMIGQSTKNSDESYRNFPGNRPSTTIVYELLTPEVMGKLLALYEHRTFVQGCIYNINSFDQWGVELGKKLSSKISEEISKDEPMKHDGSTKQLIAYYKKLAKHSGR